jgi:hypothetical protein
MLKVLFLLMLEHIRIPEAVWGGELGQARASAGEQMKTFFYYIAWRRTLLEGNPRMDGGYEDGLLQLCNLWLMSQSFTDSRILMGRIGMDWMPLSEMDAKLKLVPSSNLNGRSSCSTRAS